MHTFLDEFYLANRGYTNNYVHEFLIYGYDDEKAHYRAIAFKDRIFTEVELDYIETQLAYESGKQHIEQRGWENKMLIILRPFSTAFNPPVKYPFDYSNFIEKIKRYRKGICRKQDAYLFLQYPNKPNRSYYYGIETSKAICTFLTSTMKFSETENTESIETLHKRIYDGYNSLHMFCDHRKGMNKRLLFFHEKYTLNNEFKIYIDKYSIVSEKAENIRLLYLKMHHFLNNSDASDIQSVKVYVHNTLQKLINRLQELYLQESAILDSIIELIDFELDNKIL